MITKNTSKYLIMLFYVCVYVQYVYLYIYIYIYIYITHTHTAAQKFGISEIFYVF